MSKTRVKTIVTVGDLDELLEQRSGGLRAARIAYASEFDGDVGSIHENIRAMKAQNARLKSRGFEDLHDENEHLRAELQRLQRGIRVAINADSDQFALELEILRLLDTIDAG
jgi:hypothetical protein